MQRKIHNQTLFVAALTVYFGLALVGAPPQVFAQQTAAQPETSFVINKRPLEDFAREFKQQVADGKINFDNTCSVSVKAVVKQNGRFANAAIAEQTGDAVLCNAGVRFISAVGESGWLQYFNELYKASYKELKEPSRDITIKFDAQKSDFGLTHILALENEQRARTQQSVLNTLLAIAAQQVKGDEERDFLRHIKIEQQDNNLIIVIRLPRANLDSLLKANEKAN